jgi:hypothetical protein
VFFILTFTVLIIKVLYYEHFKKKQKLSNLDILKGIDNKLNILIEKFNYSPEKWIFDKDVKDILQISDKTLYNYREKGLLPYSKVEGKYYYKEKDVYGMLEKHYVRVKS